MALLFILTLLLTIQVISGNPLKPDITIDMTQPLPFLDLDVRAIGCRNGDVGMDGLHRDRTYTEFGTLKFREGLDINNWANNTEHLLIHDKINQIVLDINVPNGDGEVFDSIYDIAGSTQPARIGSVKLVMKTNEKLYDYKPYLMVRYEPLSGDEGKQTVWSIVTRTPSAGENYLVTLCDVGVENLN